MGGLVLACGDAGASLRTADGGIVGIAGDVTGPREALRVAALPARPGKAQVDPLLTSAVVVAGTDADLAAVVLRLLRKDLLATTTVGFVPTDSASAVAALWGLPTDPAAALELALTGTDRPVPLVRDDAGGVLVGRGAVSKVRGVGYCDDTVALRGQARSIEVHASDVSEAGLVVTVTRGRLVRPRRTSRGRAFQLGCDPTVPVSDGVPYPRPMQRWTWYRHTEDLRLVR